MKIQKKLPVVLGTVIALALAGVSYFISSSLTREIKTAYYPGENVSERSSGDWAGAAEYYHSIRANIYTGKVELSDIMRASEAVEKLKLYRSGSLNMQWKERGPDDVGGRTRAILVDKNVTDGSHVLAGSVSGGLFVSHDAGGTWQPVNDQFENLIVSSLAQAPNGDMWMGTGCTFESFNDVLFIGKGIFKSTDGGVTWLKKIGPVAPYVTINGGGGSGATATVTISSGVVQSINVISGGSGYTASPIVTVNNGGGGGSGFIVGTIVRSSNDTITSIGVGSGGSGYTDVVNNTNEDWIAINRIAIDPSNSNHIYAATNNGLRVSQDGGATWINPIPNNLSNCTGKSQARACDVEVLTGGRLFVSLIGSGVVYSDTPFNPCSYIRIVNTSTGLPYTFGRLELAAAPNNGNVIYACVVDANNGGTFQGLYESTDKGITWGKIVSPISGYFSPMCESPSSITCQGMYDLVLAVAPDNADKVFIGGVELWQYDGNLTHIAGGFTMIPFYIHSDLHIISFDPNNPQNMYIGCDGGVFKSNDQGFAFFEANKGYNVTQFYGIAYNNPSASTIPAAVLGGAQDNGTNLMNGTGLDPLGANGVMGGDGFDCDISQITGAMFGSLYFSALSRSPGSGGGFGPVCPKQGNNCIAGPFNTVVRLWESLTDATSQAKIIFRVDGDTTIVGTGNGLKKVFIGNLAPLQPSAHIVPGSLRIQAGSVSFQDSPNPTQVPETFTSGGNSCTVWYSTGQFTVTFAAPPSTNLPVRGYYITHFDSGSVLQLNSNTGDVIVPYTLTTALDYGDSLVVQDPVQSIVALGESGANGVYITRGGLDFNQDPTWIPIGVSGTPSCIEFSKDGNHMFVGMNGVGVYRVSGLNNVYTLADATNANILTKTKIFNVPNNAIAVTGLAVDNNPENVVITLGNYGHTDYVFRSSNALSLISALTYTAAPNSVITATTSLAHNLNTGDSVTVSQVSGITTTPSGKINGTYPVTVLNPTQFTYSLINSAISGIYSANSGITTTFVNASGNLPPMPVYDAEFINGTSQKVVIGTDFGVYATTDIFATSVTWSDENNGKFPHVPTFDVRQQKFWPSNNYEKLYIGTHGRGIWESGTLVTGIKEPGISNNTKTKFVSDLTVYPNPMKDEGFIAFNLKAASAGSITVYDMFGKVLKSFRKQQFNSGINRIQLDTETFPAGVYFVTVEAQNVSSVAKFVVVK